MVGSAPATRATIRDRQLRRRALAVVPGGMYGHQHVSWLAAGSPQFFERAEGCRIWDVDGNEYVDDSAPDSASTSAAAGSRSACVRTSPHSARRSPTATRSRP
jgi:4-aminobutyrate aminotransferase-like enzyme